jgi:hypothetical protein
MTRDAGARDQKKVRSSVAIAALAIGLALVPGTAFVVTPPSESVGDVSVDHAFGESWHRYGRSESSPSRPEARDLNLQQSEVERSKPSKLRFLRYSTPLRFGEVDVLFKFRAPGKKQSIMTFELRF